MPSYGGGGGVFFIPPEYYGIQGIANAVKNTADFLKEKEERDYIKEQREKRDNQLKESEEWFEKVANGEIDPDAPENRWPKRVHSHRVFGDALLDWRANDLEALSRFREAGTERTEAETEEITTLTPIRQLALETGIDYQQAQTEDLDALRDLKVEHLYSQVLSLELQNELSKEELEFLRSTEGIRREILQSDGYRKILENRQLRETLEQNSQMNEAADLFMAQHPELRQLHGTGMAGLIAAGKGQEFLTMNAEMQEAYAAAEFRYQQAVNEMQKGPEMDPHTGQLFVDLVTENSQLLPYLSETKAYMMGSRNIDPEAMAVIESTASIEFLKMVNEAAPGLDIDFLTEVRRQQEAGNLKVTDKELASWFADYVNGKGFSVTVNRKGVVSGRGPNGEVLPPTRAHVIYNSLLNTGILAGVLPESMAGEIGEFSGDVSTAPEVMPEQGGSLEETREIPKDSEPEIMSEEATKAVALGTLMRFRNDYDESIEYVSGLVDEGTVSREDADAVIAELEGMKSQSDTPLSNVQTSTNVVSQAEAFRIRMEGKAGPRFSRKMESLIDRVRRVKEAYLEKPSPVLLDSLESATNDLLEYMEEKGAIE